MPANLIADPPTLFIDRCAWSKKLGEALDLAKIPYVAHHSLFAPDATDEDWLTAVKDNGWVILTRDKNIRYKANEHRALVDAGLFMFVLRSERRGNSSHSHASLPPDTQSDSEIEPTRYLLLDADCGSESTQTQSVLAWVRRAQARG